MKKERMIIIVFTLLGIVAGYSTDYFGLIIGAAMSLALLIMPLLPLLKFFKGKKERTWLIQNSIITFALIWIVVWILLFTTSSVSASG